MKMARMSDLKRSATRILADLRETKEPVLIAEHGKPAAYLVEVNDYEIAQQRLSLLESLLEGERALAESKAVSKSEAAERLKRWLG